MRFSKQRSIILEELKLRTDHPAADQIYLAVKKKLPDISLGTIYRNLEQLAAGGIIRELHYGKGQKRFDAHQTPHIHFRCLNCDTIEDMPMEITIPVPDTLHPWMQYREITDSRLEYLGLCPLCCKDKAGDTAGISAPIK